MDEQHVRSLAALVHTKAKHARRNAVELLRLAAELERLTRDTSTEETPDGNQAKPAREAEARSRAEARVA